jgi:hypothetical protein
MDRHVLVTLTVLVSGFWPLNHEAPASTAYLIHVTGTYETGTVVSEPEVSLRPLLFGTMCSP